MQWFIIPGFMIEDFRISEDAYALEPRLLSDGDYAIPVSILDWEMLTSEMKESLNILNRVLLNDSDFEQPEPIA